MEQSKLHTGYSHQKTPIAQSKSHHFTDHDELRSKDFMNGEHTQNAEEKHHVVKCEYNSRHIETRATDGDGNKPEYETSNVRDKCQYFKKIPQIVRVVDDLELHIWRVIHCNLHNGSIQHEIAGFVTKIH